MPRFAAPLLLLTALAAPAAAQDGATASAQGLADEVLAALAAKDKERFLRCFGGELARRAPRAFEHATREGAGIKAAMPVVAARTRALWFTLEARGKDRTELSVLLLERGDAGWRVVKAGGRGDDSGGLAWLQQSEELPVGGAGSATPEEAARAWGQALGQDLGAVYGQMTLEAFLAVADSALRIHGQAMRKGFRGEVEGQPEVSGERAVVRVRIVATTGPRAGKAIDEVYAYLVRRGERWRIDGHDEDKGHPAQFLAGKRDARYWPSHPGRLAGLVATELSYGSREHARLRAVATPEGLAAALSLGKRAKAQDLTLNDEGAAETSGERAYARLAASKGGRLGPKDAAQPAGEAFVLGKDTPGGWRLVGLAGTQEAAKHYLASGQVPAGEVQLGAPAKGGAAGAPRLEVAHVRAGQRYVYEMETRAGDQTLRMRQVWHVVAKGDAAIRYRVDTVMTIMDKEHTTTGQEMDYPLALVGGKPDQDAPPDAPKPVAEEVIEVGGVKFACKVYDHSGTRTWVFPGFPAILKMESSVVSMRLVRIEQP